MKKLYTLLALVLTLITFAQAPQGFNYQATVRNSAGALIVNQNVFFKFNMMLNSASSLPVFSETHMTPTDDLGQVNLVIGTGTTTIGSFSTINWGSGNYYLGIELNTGAGYVAMGTTQLLSVPYALYANSSGTSISNFPNGTNIGDRLNWIWNGTAWIPTPTSALIPQITTTIISAVTNSTANSGGVISNSGGDTISAKGVCWSTSPNPTIGLTTQSNDGIGTTTFTSNIEGLLPTTTYYLRAYATNSFGTAYGQQEVFTTSATVIPQIVELTGDLTSQTLTNNTNYLIKGQTFVRTGIVLTIQPGTVIFGDKATKGTLIIDRGGKIVANGTPSQPIVFTSALPAGSRDRGDWGGLVILGNAPVNQLDPAIEGITPAVIYGGTVGADNSGILRYVRVEYAGIELTPNNETNSITLGGVGSDTTMEYVQVTYGGDDGFEWFGGTVNGKYLISFASWDDSFDVDFGYVGKNQFGLEVRYPSLADQSGSNSFECDNGPNDNVTTLLTEGVFSNFTCVGPKATDSQSINANYLHSLDLRRRTAVTIANSVFIGYPRGLRMNQQSVFDNYAAGTGKLLNNILVIPAASSSIIPFSVGIGMTANAAAVENLFLTNNTRVSLATADQFSVLGLSSNIAFGQNVTSSYPANPNFAVTTGILTSGASFIDAKLSGLQSVAYRGAFGTTDWTDGWAEFLPNSIVY